MSVELRVPRQYPQSVELLYPTASFGQQLDMPVLSLRPRPLSGGCISGGARDHEVTTECPPQSTTPFQDVTRVLASGSAAPECDGSACLPEPCVANKEGSGEVDSDTAHKNQQQCLDAARGKMVG